MTARKTDIAILGGGLAGGLAALAISRYAPNLAILLVEQDERLGGNHVWSFFGSDVGKAGRDLLAPLVVAAWRDYEVRFPAYERRLDTSYYSMTSERLDSVVRASLPESSILTGLRVLACSAEAATLSDGTRIEARAVIDARGIRHLGHLVGGWQKFVGRRLRFPNPHGLSRPIVMDATVDQLDGYRFVYCLPFSDTEMFIEDTYYSDSPTIDTGAIGARIDAYATAKGWVGGEVTGEETGVLPVVAGGDFDGFWRSTGGSVARLGTRGGLFQPLTSYSLPDAVRSALAVAGRAELDGAMLAAFTERRAREHWRRGRFYRQLSAMLFGAGAPIDRYRVLERFYRLDRKLIERFYAGRSTLFDKARILAGKPPVPLGDAIRVLTGAKRLAPLSLAGMRK